MTMLLGTVGLLLAIAVLFSIPALRLRFVMTPLAKLYRRALPAMSATEREALEAGDTGWDAELFSGNPDWSRLHNLPVPHLTPTEQDFLDGPVETLCNMLHDWEINQVHHDLPPEIWYYLKANKFFGLIIPAQYGGLGFSTLAHSAVVMKLASRSISSAVTVMVPNSLGPAELLLHYGTSAQKDYYLPRLANGEEIPCFALTSPEAGSDAASIPDKGIVCYGDYNGEQVLGMRVTWDKRYITLGPVATLLGLAFHLYDPDHLIGDDTDVGITLALIPTEHPGVNIGRRHYPAGQVFQNGPNSGKNVFIPLTWVIGGQPQVGQGWRMLMNCLAAGRAVSLPALSTAAAKLAMRYSGAYARIRKQFKVPIGKFEGIAAPLARIAGHAYALEAMRSVTATTLDQGQQPAVISAILKYQATERMRQAINDAMDIHGGRAICDGPSNYLFNVYQSIPISITVEGANILTRSLIIFGQGAMRCHPYLLREMRSVQANDIAEFDRALRGHAGFLLNNTAQVLWQRLSFNAFTRIPDTGAATPWYSRLARMSRSFALVADCALLSLGGELKRRENLSGRFADWLSEMYLVSCVLKRFENDGRPRADEPVVHWVCQTSFINMQRSVDEILANFPVPVLGGLLRLWVGDLKLRVNDKLQQQVAALTLSDNATRERLTQGIFVTRDPDDVTGRLEYALEKVLATAELSQRVEQAIKKGQLPAQRSPHLFALAEAQHILTHEEAKALQEAEKAVQRAIQVDDFSPELVATPPKNDELRLMGIL